MEFDRLCKEVERRFPKYRSLLEDARLFVIEENDKPRPEKSGLLSKWEPEEEVAENYRLPFPSVAMDFGNSCVVMHEVKPSERLYLAIGTHTSGRTTHFFEATITALPGQFSLDASRLGKIVGCQSLEVYQDGEAIEFSMNEISLGDGEDRRFHALSGEIAAEYSVHGYGDVKGGGCRMKLHGEYIDTTKPLSPEQQKDLRRSLGEVLWAMDGLIANVAFLELNQAVMTVLVISEPARFIVEQSSIDQKRPAGKLIRRSAYRPHYIALTPGEIKRRYLYDEHDASEIPRSPHERRGHYRRLTSERFKSKRNHIVWVKPCWVGKTEGVRGKNRYVVKLDL